ncbi:LysR family transcriptional regulator [Rudanella lutea]|uniref:LysR family transcriptional regulator n=1 Tax=Rudanella lutea TaxID=451374 RepID=UPI0003636697|nr:LysR family transcriptional regulator [Rudanella lutea]
MLLRQLEYIIAVDTERSFTRAADRCCITQPTLSQQIRCLEAHLNIEIFNRQQVPVVPTLEGELILQKARGIVAEVRALEQFARQLNRKELAVCN